MAFLNLCRICFNIEWKVELTDNEMLTLASAWPYLEELLINGDWGWNTRGGITPNGVVQLRQKCPSLRLLSAVINTRGYTQLPQSPPSLESTLPLEFFMDVLDSFIEEDAVPAMAAFFIDISPRSNSLLTFWTGWAIRKSPDHDVYFERWKDVLQRIDSAVSKHS